MPQQVNSLDQKYPKDYPQEYRDGVVRFYGRDFRVSPDVLIPRLETESLVRHARAYLKDHPHTRVADIGTGSGIIGTSVADLALECVFLDISPSALEIAKSNFYRYQKDTPSYFFVSDLLMSFIPEKPDLPTLFLANLPYIRENDWIHMSADTHFEPEIALFGGEKTGFELYERLFQEIAIYQKKVKSIPLVLMIEFGFDQYDHAQSILQQYSQWKYRFFCDHAGIFRFAEILVSEGIS